MSLFPSMVKVVPEGERGIAKVKHDRVSAFHAAMSALRGTPLSEGPICQLFVGGTLWMSDGANEHRTNYEVCVEARGRVLIAGLGLGMILTKILAKKEVEHVTIIEKYQDVIDLVGPHFKHKKLQIICADIYEWRPAKGAKFDCIYFDVWADQSTDDLEDMRKLHQAFKSFKAQGAWMESWNRAHLQSRKRRGL